jgi:hypothetical protein
MKVSLTMNINTTFCLLGLIPLVVSCAQPLTLGPVGPGPSAGRSSSSRTGYLQVFSSLAEESDDQNQGGSGGNPVWFQHTDYNIYDAKGKRVKHVDNTVGHYSTSPRLVSLKPGTYTVKARAEDWLSVKIPVLIEPGRTTKVHLDDNWRPPAGTPKAEVVTSPGGHPVGWSADPGIQVPRS